MDEAAMLERWQKDRTDLLLRLPFLGLVAMQLEMRVGRWQAIPTAATDGETVFGNVDFLSGLNDEERLFLLAHEVWHCAALHLHRRGEREPMRWNVAVDLETNAVLDDAGFTVPVGGLLHRRSAGRSAEELYDWLGEKNPPDRGRFADEHGPGRADDWPGLQQPADGRAAKRRVQAALQQAGSRPGNLPGMMQRELKGLLQPSVPWQQVLAQFVGRRRSESAEWTRPNRRHLSLGRHFPGFTRSRLNLAVGLDTSGSTRRVLPQFMGELAGVLHAQGRESAVRLIQFDAAIQSDEVITGRLTANHQPVLHGGGGTDFRPLFTALVDDHPDALIILTDGYGPAPMQPPGWPVLWALAEGGERPVSWGAETRVQ